MVGHGATLIHRFLEVDVDGVVNERHAAAAWPLIIGMVYPVLAEKPLEVMLLVMRSIRNQKDNVLAHIDFMEIFSGAGCITVSMVKAGLHLQLHNAISIMALLLTLSTMLVTILCRVEASFARVCSNELHHETWDVVAVVVLHSVEQAPKPRKTRKLLPGHWPRREVCPQRKSLNVA